MSGWEQCPHFLGHKLPPGSACPHPPTHAALAGFIAANQHLTPRIYSGGLRSSLCGSAEKGLRIKKDVQAMDSNCLSEISHAVWIISDPITLCLSY